MKFVDRDVRMHRFQTGSIAASDELDGRAHERLPLGALSSCTLAAVMDHADARGWDVGHVTVETARVDDRGVPRVARLIEVGETLDDDQHAELMLVCNDTPMTRVVARAAEISTLILDDARGNGGLIAGEVSDAERADEIRRREAAIDRVLEDSFPASDPPPWTCGA